MIVSRHAKIAAPRFFALIPAAGVGTRMEMDCPKQYLSLLGKPVLWHSVTAFLACGKIERIYVVVSAQDKWLNQMMASFHDIDMGKVRFLRCGGATRRETVINGLNAIKDACLPHDWVLVHDAARPGLTAELIDKLLDTAQESPDGAILALPVVDTVKRQLKNRVKTLSREGLWLAQTPQMFPYALLRKALQQHENVTDEASAMEAMGRVPRLVEGQVRNTKITRPIDLVLVETLMKSQGGI